MKLVFIISTFILFSNCDTKIKYNQDKKIDLPPDSPATGIISKQDYEKIKNKVEDVIKDTKKELDNDLKKDPEIKCETEVKYLNDHYVLEIYGWNHNEIVYSARISGSFDDIKNAKLKEIKKCEEVIYSKAVQKLKELQ